MLDNHRWLIVITLYQTTSKAYHKLKIIRQYTQMIKQNYRIISLKAFVIFLDEEKQKVWCSSWNINKHQKYANMKGKAATDIKDDKYVLITMVLLHIINEKYFCFERLLPQC